MNQSVPIRSMNDKILCLIGIPFSESMNSVMDDNRMLTFASNERFDVSIIYIDDGSESKSIYAKRQDLVYLKQLILMSCET